MLGNDASRAFYGPGHVVAAAQEGAVAKLLIADSLYRCGFCTRRGSSSTLNCTAELFYVDVL